MSMADTIAVMNAGRIEQLGDPTTLYERPATTFAANFLGQSNLLSGRVVSREGDNLVVDVQGQKLALEAARSRVGDGSLWLGVRPEKLRVAAAGAPAPDGALATAGHLNELTGTVLDTSFIGVSTQYLVQLPWDQQVMAVQQNDGSALLRPGDEVRLSWGSNHGFGLDASQDAHAGEGDEEGS